MISSYEVVDGKIHVKTPYSEEVVKTCRGWAGKYQNGAWVLPLSRLEQVQEKLGVNQDDQVEVRVTSEDWTGYQQLRVGWYILAGRRSRDYSADVYADLMAGTIPSSGGSVKNPSVSPSNDAVFHLWVPRDFAVARNLTIVTDPKASEPPPPQMRMQVVSGDEAIKHLEWAFTALSKIDPQCLSEFERQLLERISEKG